MPFSSLSPNSCGLRFLRLPRFHLGGNPSLFKSHQEGYAYSYTLADTKPPSHTLLIVAQNAVERAALSSTPPSITLALTPVVLVLPRRHQYLIRIRSLGPEGLAWEKQGRASDMFHPYTGQVARQERHVSLGISIVGTREPSATVLRGFQHLRKIAERVFIPRFLQLS